MKLEIYPFGKILLRKCLFTALQHKLEEILGMLINYSNDVDNCNEDRCYGLLLNRNNRRDVSSSSKLPLCCVVTIVNLWNIEILMHDISSLVKIMLRICLFATLQHKLGEICGILIYFSNDVGSWSENRCYGLSLNRNNRRDVSTSSKLPLELICYVKI